MGFESFNIFVIPKLLNILIGLMALSGKRTKHELDVDDQKLRMSFQKILGTHIPIYHYEMTLKMAFPFELIYGLKFVKICHF